MLLLGCSSGSDPGGKGTSPLDECNVQESSCSAVLAPGINLAMDILPKPVKVMTDLKFEIFLSGPDGPIDGANVELALSMPDMFMGENSQRLSRVGTGIYRGNFVIPRCASGKTLWKADIRVRLPGIDANTRFAFNVK